MVLKLSSKDGLLTRIKGVIFDCDGVMLDSRAANVGLYNKILARFGYGQLTPEQEDHVHMVTFEQSLAYLLTPEEIEETLSWLNEAEDAHDYYAQLTLEDNLLELLDWLQQSGVRLGVCTNRHGMDSLLEHFALDGYFSLLQTASNSIPKPDPDGLLQALDAWSLPATEVAFIGDSVVDEMAARAAGVNFWAFKNSSLNAGLHIKGFSALHNHLRQALK